MDSYEAARAVFSRIQTVDPDNASKIIAYILLQEQPEKEMIRLAFGPDTLIHSIISVAKSELGLSSNTLSAPNTSPSPPLFTSVSNPISISKTNPRSLSLPSPRIAHNGLNVSSPSSPSIWSISGSSNQNPLSPDSNHSPSYAAVVNGSLSPQTTHEYQFQDQDLSFLNDQSLDCKSESLVYPFHRRSFSLNDGYFGTDDSTSGFGYKPCLYFAKGFCKNGGGCKFVHGGAGFVDSENSSSGVGSPCKFDGIPAAQYMAGLNFPYNKLNYLQSEAQRSAAAALMMGEDFHKLNRQRFGRSDFSGLGCGESNPGSRQIYLTFPADSTFKEEDVANYFSLYGPVQDVRIPYQQKRMFGFVTFVYSETVKMILAKGNPHFVCDSRVLVKPYKEKGKLLDKKQHQQQLDRSEFSSLGSPSALDCREPFEMHVGPRMFQNNQEMMLRKKLEQEAEWQQVLELQSRRLMNLQLLDLKNQNRYQQNAPVGSPPHSLNQNIFPGDIPHVTLEDSGIGSPNGSSPTGQLKEEVSAISSSSNGIYKEDNPNHEESDLPESMEHILPDSLFASPTKFAAEEQSAFASTTAAVDNAATASTSTANDNPLTPPTSALNIPSLKSCFLETPRISSGHEAVGM